MGMALVKKEEIQEHHVDWLYQADVFLFQQQGINSKASVHAYRHAIKCFIQFMEQEGITRPTPADVFAYEGHLRSRQYSDFTKSLYLHLLKRYFAFLERHIDLESGRTVKVYPDICKGLKITCKRPPRAPVRNSLTDRDVKRLRTHLRGLEGQGAARDLLMVELCLFNGLRDCEVARLRLQDIVIDDDKVRMYLWRKGRTARNSNDFVYLQPKLHKRLMSYVRKYRIKNYIFADVNHRSPRAEHLHPGTVSMVISRRMREAGVKRENTTPHSCRHWFATALLKKGTSVFDVQRSMGHSDLQSTLVYLHTKQLFEDNPCELALEY